MNSPSDHPSSSPQERPGSPAQRLAIAFAMPPWFDVPPQAYGGIESLVADLVDAMVGRGHSVFMVGAGRDGTRAQFSRTYEVAPSERIGEAMPEVLHTVWSY